MFQKPSFNYLFFTVLALLLLQKAPAQPAQADSSLPNFTARTAVSVTQTRLLGVSTGRHFYTGILRTQLKNDLQPKAFTCRKELLMQQRLRLPLYLRLGSILESDRLEGKN